MKALEILGALFTSLNSVRPMQGTPQAKKSKVYSRRSKVKRTKGARDRNQRARANRRKSKRC